MKLPIDYKDFAKDPVKGLLFIALSSIGYLYLDNKMNYQDQIEMCYDKTIQLEQKVDKLTKHVNKSDSALAVATTKLKILTQLNKIEDI
jgi:hypothetical protein